MGDTGDWEEVAQEPETEDVEVVYEEAEPEAVYEEEEERRPPPAPAARAHADKSVFAMVSGLGFFFAVLLLLFGVWGPGREGFLGLIVAGMILGTAIPYLWMLDDLRFRPRRMKKSHARFMAGPLIGVLAIVLFGMFNVAGGNWILLVMGIAVVVVTQVSVSLFLYSMLWEE